MRRLRLLLLVSATIAISSAGPSAAARFAAPPSAAPAGLGTLQHWATQAVSNALSVSVRPGKIIYFNSLLKISCKPVTTRRFHCSFRAIDVDERWIGQGVVTSADSQGTGIWTATMHGREEACGPNGCALVRPYRWHGRVQPFG
jgi:hypothetical protein